MEILLSKVCLDGLLNKSGYLQIFPKNSKCSTNINVNKDFPLFCQSSLQLRNLAVVMLYSKEGFWRVTEQAFIYYKQKYSFKKLLIRNSTLRWTEASALMYECISIFILMMEIFVIFYLIPLSYYSQSTWVMCKHLLLNLQETCEELCIPQNFTILRTFLYWLKSLVSSIKICVPNIKNKTDPLRWWRNQPLPVFQTSQPLLEHRRINIYIINA